MEIENWGLRITETGSGNGREGAGGVVGVAAAIFDFSDRGHASFVLVATPGEMGSEGRSGGSFGLRRVRALF